MNVLLVYPEFPDTFWSFKHALRFIRKKASSPPLGLLTVAAMLPGDWAKRLVDTNVRHLTDADLAWADYVFISAMAVQRASARELIGRARKAGRPVVAGGPLFTLESEAFPEVDHLVLNEAELTLPLFLSDLERGSAQRVYSSTAFADLGRTPVPAWELADLACYDSLSIQFSRGCPFSCDFCNITPLLGHVPRTKRAAQIVAELDAIVAQGWRRSVFFVDDNFVGNKRRIKTEVLPALIDWRKGRTGLPFQTEASINLADDDELMHLMREAGFDTVFVGIETPSEPGLAECGKSQNTKRDMLASVRRLQQAGLQVQGGFIVGFDSDTPSIFEQQIDFIQRSGIVTAMVGLLQAVHRTPLYDRLAREGRLLPEISGDNMKGTNIVPVMGIEVLTAGYVRILQTIYAPRHYYARVRTFLRTYRPPKVRARLELSSVMAFFRSVWRLGVTGAERRHYWRLLGWTTLRRPTLLPLAVTMAIMGHHFRVVCEMHIAQAETSGP